MDGVARSKSHETSEKIHDTYDFSMSDIARSKLHETSDVETVSGIGRGLGGG